MTATKRFRPVLSRRMRTGGLLTVSVLLIAGCSSSGGSAKSSSSADTSTSSTATTATDTATSSRSSADNGSSTPSSSVTTARSDTPAASGAAGVAALLAQYSKPPAPAEVPFSTIAPSVAKLKGKTVFYIPILIVAPLFKTQNDLLKRAAAKAGVTIQTCSGNGNPADITSCFTQAVAAKAAGIISDSVPPELVPQAYQKAVAAKVPVVALNINEAVPAAYASGVTAFDRQELLQGRISADQIIADSKGKAKVLLVSLNDSNTSRNTVNNAILPEFAKNCPACKIYRVDLNNSQFATVPSLTSAGLTAHPDVTYVYAEYDVLAQGAVQGIRTLQKTNTVKLVSVNGDFGGLQRIKAGTQYADTGADLNYEAWSSLDMVFRMSAGLDAMAATHGKLIPIRTYTKSTISDLSLTQSAYESGAWFGSPTYEAKYSALWGAK